MRTGKLFNITEGVYSIHAVNEISAGTRLEFWFLYARGDFQQIPHQVVKHTSVGEMFYSFYCSKVCLIAMTPAVSLQVNFIPTTMIEVGLEFKRIPNKISIIC